MSAPGMDAIGLEMEEVVDVYDCCVNGSVAWEVIGHDGFERFALSVTEFLRSVGGDQGEQVEQAVSELKRARSDLTISLLPFCHQNSPLTSRVDVLRARAAVIEEQMGPGDPVNERLREAVESLAELANLMDRPLFDRLVELVRGRPDERIAVVSPGRVSHVEDARQALQRFGDRLEVVTPAELANLPAFETLCVLGTPGWYIHRRGEFVLTVPRAQQVLVVLWSWIGVDGLPPRAEIIGGRTGSVGPRPVAAPPRPSRGALRVHEDEVPEVVDWVGMRDRAKSDGDAGDGAQDEVEARLFLLAEDHGVLLESVGKKQEVVEPDLEGDDRIQTVDVADLDAGHHVLLRTQGDGSLVRVEADRLLGTFAGPLREDQREWKRRLRAANASYGMDGLCRRLEQAGCAKASPQNVRNWMSLGSIRPRKASFRAIMKVIGIEDDEVFWISMTKIYSAHISAGRTISNQLKAVVGDKDLDDLIRTGRMQFELDEGAGGTLDAFRVDDVDDELHFVAEGRLGHPFSVDPFTGNR